MHYFYIIFAVLIKCDGVYNNVSDINIQYTLWSMTLYVLNPTYSK